MARANISKLVKSAKETPLYSYAPDEPFNPYFYIHYHQNNVGRMGNHPAQSDSDMANIFKAYKYGKDSIVNDAITRQYVQLIQRSINTSKENENSVKIINKVFSQKNNSDEISNILDTLHDGLKKGFEDQFQPNKIQQMLEIASNVKWSKKQKSVKSLVEVLNGTADSKQAQSGFVFLDRLLQAMADTVSLLRSPIGGLIAVDLIALKNSKTKSVTKLGNDMLSILNKYEKEFNGETFEGEQLKEVAGYMKDIATVLGTGKNLKGDKDLNLDILQGLVTKEFFPMTAEVLAADINEASKDAIVKYTLDALENIRSGDIPIEIQMTDTDGTLLGSNFRNSYFNEQSNYSKEQGKADNKFNNVTINMEKLFEGGEGSISMSVGISNKAYVTNYVNGQGLKELNNHYSLGGGISVGQGLDLFLGQRSNMYNKYLAFNVFAHTHNGEGFIDALHALQDVLLTRGSVYLAGGRNVGDFSQLLLLNGEILPVWDVIKYVMNNNVGLSRFEQSSLDEDDKTGVYMTIPNRSNFWNYMTERDGFIRTKNTNQIIGNAAIHMHIIPKKIIAYASSIKKS